MISLVVPVYNEELIIEELFNRSINAMSQLGSDFEIICVDDGSTDQTFELLVKFHQLDQRFKVLSLSRNFGHQSAILAGLTESKGDFIGIMDGDLQDPPELFEQFHAKIQEGYDVVYAVRKKRKESPLKKLSYWIYYRLLHSFSKTKLPLDSGDFSLMTRKVLNQVLQMPEQSLFIRGLRFWVGFKQIGLEYERDARIGGEPKYGFKQLLKLAYSGIFSFSDVPIKILGRIGSISILICSFYALHLFVRKFFTGMFQKVLLL